jgi:hypothetical protein
VVSGITSVNRVRTIPRARLVSGCSENAAYAGIVTANRMWASIGRLPMAMPTTTHARRRRSLSAARRHFTMSSDKHPSVRNVSACQNTRSSFCDVHAREDASPQRLAAGVAAIRFPTTSTPPVRSVAESIAGPIQRAPTTGSGRGNV